VVNSIVGVGAEGKLPADLPTNGIDGRRAAILDKYNKRERRIAERKPFNRR